MLVLGALVLAAVAGGIAGSIAAFGGSATPAQHPGADRQESRSIRQRNDRADQPPAHPARPHRPVLAVVGASFAAGVGAGNRHNAWPEDLARILHGRVAVSADPGAGYVNPGAGHRGPFSRLAARLNLARLDPGVVIIQGGHDDIGRPLTLIRERVESLVAAIRREVPHARLAVLTVFARGNRLSRAAWATDQTIVAAARHADPPVLVFDPLAGRWHFPRIGDHLHPTAAGHRWIAERLAAGLRERMPTT
jgi:acyl-CoA thioesterase-1